jgi:hypothetical protein
LLSDPSTRPWMDRLISYYLATGNGQKINRIHDAIAAIEELSAFLDSIVGGRRLDGMVILRVCGRDPRRVRSLGIVDQAQQGLVRGHVRK